MADIKRQDITLQDWTKGISADEYAGGSYFYSEGISSGYTTKGFELGPYLGKTAINNRSKGYPVALAPSTNYGMLAFTEDGMIEAEDTYNSLHGAGDEDGGGALLSKFGWGTYETYINGLAYGNTIIAISKRYIDLLDISGTGTPGFTPTSELLSEPNFDNSGADWTLGTGWTITDDGAEHTTGETGTLSATINFGTPPTTSDYLRVAVKIKGNSAGRLTVELDNPSSQYDISGNGWSTLLLQCSASTTGLVITPSSNFNGTIEAVNVHKYTGLEYHKATLYGTTVDVPHPALVWEGDLYVACGNYVDIFSLTDWGRTYRQLVDKNFTIVSMTQQAGNIILRATNGYDSRQYYWDGVDAVATEVIEWKGLIIKGVTGTETISYVLTTSGSNTGAVDGYEYRLYAVSGYQRSLLASKLYQYMSSNYLEEAPYNINKKFDFNDVKNDQSMIVYLDSLFLPGCDGIYKYGSDIPGLSSAWTRPIKYDTGAKHITLGQRNDYMNIGYNVDGTNYIGKIDNRLYTNNGYIVTESIYWDKLSTRKAIEKIKIGYKNVASSVGNIKVYMIVDDDYFWRFWVSSTPTNRPEIGDIYSVAHNTTGKVINVDKTNGIITFVTVSNGGSYIGTANTTLTKVSGSGDDSISVGYKFDNMCLIKTIETATQGYGSDLIFGKDFVNNHIPYWHKIQFVIELNSNDRYISPEIHELSMVSDITDITL